MIKIAFKRGDTWALTFSWTDSDSGAAIDLTDATALLQLRVSADEEPIISWDTDAGLSIDAAAGEVLLTAGAETTATLDPGLYLADLQVIFVDGTVESTDTFRFEILPDISHNEVAP